MQAMIDELAKQAEESLGQVSSKETLASFWQEYLSKNGKIPALMKNLRTVAPEERPAMGKIINELKQKVQAEYDAAAEKVKAAELAARNAAETVDITLPAKTRTVGGLHPLTLVTNQIIDVFSGMGFAVADAPEIEDDDHNFTRLNVPHAACRTVRALRASCACSRSCMPSRSKPASSRSISARSIPLRVRAARILYSPQPLSRSFSRTKAAA